MQIKQQELSKIFEKYAINRKQNQTMFKKLENKSIFQAVIRQVVYEQGQKTNQGYYIMSGTASVLASYNNKNQKFVISQVGPQQVTNSQIILTQHKYQKYSLVVTSSYLHYIKIDNEILQALLHKQQENILNRQLLREKLIKIRNDKAQKLKTAEKQQSIYNKLLLPALVKHSSTEFKDEQNLQKKYEVLNGEQANKMVRKKPFLQKSPGKGKYNQKLEKLKKHESQSIFKKLLDKGMEQKVTLFDYNQSALEKYKNQIRIKAMMNKSNSQRSLIEKEGVERDEKLFKEHLKSIIKRKITYERKHLGVLKAFKNNPQNKQQDANRMNKKYSNEKVDQFFYM